MNNKFFIFGSTVLIVLLLFLLVRIPVINVSYDDGGFQLTEDSFEIYWIHSVEKEPWLETYEKKGDRLILAKTRFKTFGAGTPSDGEIIPSNDGFVHMKIDREVEGVELIVSKNVETTLITESREYHLFELVEDYENVSIRINKLPLWQYLRGEIS
ncbi:DUF1850 domain-containing protein [Sutcliffiella horikoshii]|uniref:DUF1850 domain-containing protein n=1 Tax=Sutcliffiella horikoshii TaxID=79883 RepID=A0A5D4T3D8_9BACI|nr:DUF1850 domain-containing protein [Sutcliffiella horikoshii]TYS70217.1 DUF1850 domain-containing protein [Sutcliffiella horikoshii]